MNHASPLKITKAVFPAAGLGTRFLPATKAIPKEMLPLLDRPSIQWTVEEAVASGLSELVLVTARGKESIEDHFDVDRELEHHLERCGKMDYLATVRHIGRMCTLTAVRQKEPRGLGHAVLTARPVVGESWFAVLLADDIIDADPPFIGQMTRLAERHGKAVVALQRIPREKISRYGVVAGVEVERGVFDVSEMVEKPAAADAPSDLAVVGRYVLPPDVFEVLERTAPGKGGEIQLTDALRELAHQGRMMGLIIDGKRLDTGTPLGLIEAQLHLGLKDPTLGPDLRELLAHLR